MNIERKENETLLQYYYRLVKDRKEMDLDYVELEKLMLGDTPYSSENVRKAVYFLDLVLEKLLNEEKEKTLKGTSNTERESFIKELEEKKAEFEKEKIRFQDQKREYRKYLREDGRFEHLVDEMKISINELNKSKPLFSHHTHYIDIKHNTNEAVLMTSDWHIGSKFKNYFAEYSIDIAKDRVKELISQTILKCKMHNVSTIHLELLGDCVEGIIHLGNRVEAEEDVISQIMIYCEILSEAINELTNNGFIVKVHSVLGNHTRVVANAKESMNKENFERLVPWYLETRLNNNKNVEIISSPISDEIDIYDVLNTKIVCVHGHKDKPQNAVDKIVKMLRVFPDEIHLGHYHNDYEKSDYDILTIVNGTLKGTDNYAIDLRVTGRPMQKLLIYDNEGLLCEYKIKL